jgi:hypothetical protein
VAVCSDQEVLHAADNVAGAVTTSPGQVADAVADAARRAGRVTVLCTYQSLPVVTAAHRGHRLGQWDLVVVDEAHCTAGPAGRAWNAVHDDAQVAAQRRLYMTATPRIFGAGGETAVSMDDTAVYGPVVFELPAGTAIERGLLADWELLVPVIDPSQLDPAVLAAGAHLRVGRVAIDARVLAVQIAVLRAAAVHDLRALITFHHRVSAARAWAMTLPQVWELLASGDRPAAVSARHLHGEQPPALRRSVLDELRAARSNDGLRVVSNARVLGQGVDVPSVDAVALIDPRSSEIDIVQIIGRALRTGGRTGKIAKIIVPVVIEAGQSPQAALEGSAFAPLWRVLCALRAHDGRLAEQLDAARAAAGDSAADPDGPPATWQVPEWLSLTGMPLPDGFARAVLLTAVQATAPAWLEYYGAARAYHRRHGDLLVPERYRTDDGRRLGHWLVNQRIRRRQGLLPPDQIHKLDELGMCWGTPAPEWEEGLRHAAEYHHRDTGPPSDRQARVLDAATTWECEHGYPVGLWLSGQRKLANRGDLTAERIARLDELGMVWDLRDHKWKTMYALAETFHDEHGHLRIPPGHRPGGARVALWLTQQRQRHQQGLLSSDRVTALERIGIVWNTSDRSWRRGYQAALAFHRVHGHLDVPDKTVIDGVDVAAWLNVRRTARRAGTLPAAHHTALQNLGINWRPTPWEQGLDGLTRFYRDHGPGALVLTGHLTASGLRLDVWVSARRADRRAGTLPDAKITALDAIGFIWDGMDQDWEAGLADLADYHAKHGHIRMRLDQPGTRIPDLGRWLDRRRADHHTGRLPADRAAALDRYGMVWDRVVGRNIVALTAVAAFHRAHGHLRIPARTLIDGVDVAAWLASRRARYHRPATCGRLQPALIDALNAIDPAWHQTQRPYRPRRRREAAEPSPTPR